MGVLPVNLTDLVPIANSAWDAAAKAWAFDAGKAIAERATAINAACAAAIVGGFSSSALGAAYSYDSAIEDQLNLIGATAANIDMPYPCTDSAGVKAEIIHSALQIKTVLDAGLVFKSTQLSKARALKVQLNALSASPSTSQADMDSIIW
ncbi:MAG: hypothetical protein JKY87_04565 [Mariprofundus sp.]|nr:hypothetical protein [Mariprofundus sp.]